MITKKEAAIISAYTGVLLGDFSEMCKYAEQIMERPIWTHQYADKDFVNEIKQKAKENFCDLAIMDANSIPPDPQHGREPEPKPLAQYLGEYLAAGIDRIHDAGMPMDFTKEGLKPILQQALDAYESTENVLITIIKKKAR